jgi:hypothetical protein
MYEWKVLNNFLGIFPKARSVYASNASHGWNLHMFFLRFSCSDNQGFFCVPSQGYAHRFPIDIMTNECGMTKTSLSGLLPQALRFWWGRFKMTANTQMSKRIWYNQSWVHQSAIIYRMRAQCIFFLLHNVWIKQKQKCIVVCISVMLLHLFIHLLLPSLLSFEFIVKQYFVRRNSYKAQKNVYNIYIK